MSTPAAPRPSLPNRLRMRIGDPIVKWLVHRRPSESTAILHTARKDGSPRTTAVIAFRRDGARFVVALYGLSWWARDLRSGRPAELELGGSRRAVVATELTGDDGVAFWRWFAAEQARYAQRYAKASAVPDEAELRNLAATFPAFRFD
ncbi:MAG TPA: nitroreductase/quinone reductase family protein [Candidatus Limnocylindrales bacterium]|nr:nitroreductase/quinone reductase family protein [Candidatus Limnocylindrales bacterium]